MLFIMLLQVGLMLVSPSPFLLSLNLNLFQWSYALISYQQSNTTLPPLPCAECLLVDLCLASTAFGANVQTLSDHTSPKPVLNSPIV
jgi:hypothetical protein